MEKRRQNFEDWYKEQTAQIDLMPISSVQTRREELKIQLENLHTLMRDDKISIDRKKYYKGRRKFITQLISHTNDRIKLFNVVAHNGVSKNLALRFVQIASKELPQKLFQRIYALSAMEEEKEENNIESIRNFVAQYKNSFEKEGM